MKNIVILGSTGSIGRSALSVVRQHPRSFNIVGLTANLNHALLLEQIDEFRPDLVAVSDPDAAHKVRSGTGIEVLEGEEGLVEVASRDDADFVISAIVGSAGLASGSASRSAATEAFDPSGTGTGYKIQRRTSLCLQYSDLADISADKTSFSDGMVSSGGSYHYRIRSYNALVESPYSNQVSITAGSGSSGDDGFYSCFIATAAYGGPQAPQVETLRAFRDRLLMKSAPGRALVRLYYKYSPRMAEYIKGRPALRFSVRLVLGPLVFGVRHPVCAAVVLPCTLMAFAALALRKRRRH